MKWRPIHTAPKNGRELLLYSPVHGKVFGQWEQVEGGGHPENGDPIFWWVSDQCEFLDGPYDAPTHWMYAPKDPLQFVKECRSLAR